MYAPYESVLMFNVELLAQYSHYQFHSVVIHRTMHFYIFTLVTSKCRSNHWQTDWHHL